jgi:hypothetical protein
VLIVFIVILHLLTIGMFLAAGVAWARGVSKRRKREGNDKVERLPKSAANVATDSEDSIAQAKLAFSRPAFASRQYNSTPSVAWHDDVCGGGSDGDDASTSPRVGNAGGGNHARPMRSVSYQTGTLPVSIPEDDTNQDCDDGKPMPSRKLNTIPSEDGNDKKESAFAGRSGHVVRSAARPAPPMRASRKVYSNDENI